MATQNPLDGARDLQKMLVDYAKQETVEPLKTLGGYLVWGIAGAIMMFLGLFFFGIGTLRLLQTEASLDGNSWMSLLAYLGAIAVLIGAMVSLFLAFLRAKNRALS
ncbi:MAG: hypothetical protein R2706_17805 [Acidimicrobiales bacterium]